MRYRTLGKTGLQVSEIGFGGEWLERHSTEEAVALLRYAHEKGVNIVDCWMADPKSRDVIGMAMEGQREEWIVQGHIGSTWQGVPGTWPLSGPPSRICCAACARTISTWA